LKIDKINEEDHNAYKRYWENKSYEASMVNTIKFDREYNLKKAKKEKAIEIAKNLINAGVEKELK